MATHFERLTEVRGDLAVPHPSGKLVCVACAHRCKLADGARGVCLVRRRQGTGLAVPWGYAAGVAVDPIEKKPFFHVLPGARALSFGMLGCDFHCDFCQNWVTSQTLRDPRASATAMPVTAAELVQAGRSRQCQVITSTYNEPLITAEWAHEIFTLARRAGMLTGIVSNGHGTPEVMDYLAPLLDACKVDLKAFRQETYRSLGGTLEAVLDTITGLVGRGVWVEIVTLVVPDLNDSDRELSEIARFIAGLSPDIPWHVTAFHPDYRHTGPPRTPASTLIRAARLGAEAGLRHVYAGNLPGRTGDLEDTRCPSCGTVLIRRQGFSVIENRLAGKGLCPSCTAPVAGVWSATEKPVPVSLAKP